MITWYDRLMIHTSIENIEDIKFQISKKEYPRNIYCIVDSNDKDNLFDVLSLWELSNGLYDNLEVNILGIAKGKSNIQQVLIKLVESLINEEGNIDKNLLYVRGGD